MISSLITLIVFLCLICLVVYLVYFILSRIPLPDPVKTVVYVLMGLVLLLWVLTNFDLVNLRL